jgi:hypothetical protein
MRAFVVSGDVVAGRNSKYIGGYDYRTDAQNPKDYEYHVHFYSSRAATGELDNICKIRADLVRAYSAGVCGILALRTDGSN